ncbi:MAG: type IV pilus assembly protein PilM [bacterium]|nr:type IV pilus assembly protein PilM [bacterium]
MNIFSAPSKYPFGLDISDRSFKIVQLNKKRHNIVLQAIGKWRVPSGAIEDGIIKDQKTVIGIINKLINKPMYGKISSKNVIASLPETKTFINLIDIDASEGEFRNVLERKIEKNIPYTLDEVNYDWQVVEKNKKIKKVLVGIVEKKVANQYYNILNEAGLTPIALEIEAVAISRSLLPISAKKILPTLIVDVGAERSSCVAFANNSILFTMSLPLSGHEITDDIAKKLRIPKHKAEAAKIVCGLDPHHANGDIAKILNNKIKKLADRIKEVAEHLRTNYPEYSEVNRIYLSGGGTQINGIADKLTSELKIPVYIGNVLMNFNINYSIEQKYLHEEYSTFKKLAKKNKVKQNMSLQFATAIGLALRGIYSDKLK